MVTVTYAHSNPIQANEILGYLKAQSWMKVSPKSILSKVHSQVLAPLSSSGTVL